MATKFTKWVRWEDRTSLPGIQFPGVYALAKTLKPMDGTRFTYVKEIVYFGMTNSKGGLKSRLKQFDNVMNGRRGHGGADRFLYKFPNVRRLRNQLYVAISVTECDVSSNSPKDLLLMGDVAKQEYECWAKYVRRHGRLPKFNDKLNSPKIVWDPIEKLQ